MTYTQFLSQVRKLNKKWVRSEENVFRCRDGDCPLVALQRSIGFSSPSWAPDAAAPKLGLQVSVAERIANMADANIPPTPGFLRALGIRKKDLK